MLVIKLSQVATTNTKQGLSFVGRLSESGHRVSCTVFLNSSRRCLHQMFLNLNIMTCSLQTTAGRFGRGGCSTTWAVFLCTSGQYNLHHQKSPDLNMSMSSLSMGMLPIVFRKKSSSIVEPETTRRVGRSRRSLPNLRGRGGIMF